MAFAMQNNVRRGLEGAPDRSAASAAPRPSSARAAAPQPSRPIVICKAGAAAENSAAARPERTLVGVLALLACTALFPVSDTAAKILTSDLPPLEVAWLRYFVFMVMTVPILLRGSKVLATERPKLQVGRALASATSTVIAICSFGFMPVAESTAIGFVAPVVVTAMAAMFLGEKVGLRRWTAALVGLAGVLIMVQPGTSAFQLASLIPLCGSLASASSTIATRMAKAERPDTTLLYSAVIGFAILSVLVLFHWQTPSWPQVAIGAVVGFFATLASLMQVYAYRHAPASLLAPFTYTQLIWASGLGFLVFGTVPGPAMLCGAAVVAASGIYTAWRETVRSPGDRRQQTGR